MIRATVDINGTPIATLTCRNISGGNGWCRYECRYEAGETAHTFQVRHNRPSGAPALLATAFGMLAEAGVGQAQLAFDVTNSEESTT